MKSLLNKQTTIKDSEREDYLFKYSDLIKVVCDKPPAQGWTTTIMKQRLRIQDIIEQSKEVIELEDSDATAVSVLVKSMTWAIKHKDLVQFEEDVISAF